MDPLDIQHELRKKRYHPGIHCQEARVSPNHVSAVIRFPDKRPSRRVRRAVAEAIGKDYTSVFGDQYQREIRR